MVKNWNKKASWTNSQERKSVHLSDDYNLENWKKLTKLPRM